MGKPAVGGACPVLPPETRCRSLSAVPRWVPEGALQKQCPI